MAPMTRNPAGPGNVPTSLNSTYYAAHQFLRDKTNRRGDRKWRERAQSRALFWSRLAEALISELSAEHVGVRLSSTKPFNHITDSNPASSICTLSNSLQAIH
jgi:2,4-dienoyl-CoA reductase-like NADH-dependent reductase (Old Yellow Enzyme family)